MNKKIESCLMSLGGKFLLHAYLPEEERKKSNPFDPWFEPPNTPHGRLSLAVHLVTGALSAILQKEEQEARETVIRRERSGDEGAEYIAPTYTAADVDTAEKYGKAIEFANRQMENPDWVARTDARVNDRIAALGYASAAADLLICLGWKI